MIILTGSKGFIGKNFIKKLGNHNVFEVDIDTCEYLLKRKSLTETYEFWSSVDLIVHQGAVSSTTEKDPRKLYKYNIDYSISLFELAIKYGIPVKYASSASVYGNSKDRFNPLNHYALSKLQVDYWVQDNIDKFSLVQGFRYFNVYGSGEEDKKDQASPVSKFSKQAIETGSINVFEGSERMQRDFICVDDVVDIVLNNDQQSGIYDLGIGNPASFLEVAELVSKKYNAKIREIPFPEHLRGRYQFYTCADMSWTDKKFLTLEDYLS
jgi:ADP-L-glycero-D-manno-heptose 6-epimerase